MHRTAKRTDGRILVIVAGKGKGDKVAYDSGATDEDVALLIREMVLTPLMNLNSHQNNELITKSKISVPKKETHEVT